MSPYQILSDPVLRDSLTAWVLSSLPASPSTQAAILDAFGGLAPVPFTVDAVETGGVGGLLVVSGKATIRYPADGTGSYLVRGIALVSEQAGPTILGWAVLDEQLRLEAPGDSVVLEFSYTVQNAGA